MKDPYTTDPYDLLHGPEEETSEEPVCRVCMGSPAYPPTEVDGEWVGYCKTCNDNSVFVTMEKYMELHPDEFDRRLIG